MKKNSTHAPRVHERSHLRCTHTPVPHHGSHCFQLFSPTDFVGFGENNFFLAMPAYVKHRHCRKKMKSPHFHRNLSRKTCCETFLQIDRPNFYVDFVLTRVSKIEATSIFLSSNQLPIEKDPGTNFCGLGPSSFECACFISWVWCFEG